MNLMTSSFAATALGISPPPKVDPEFVTITTDSRKTVPGCLFVALKGEKFDGHDFIGQALEQGASGILCREGSRPGEVPEGAVILEVRDTLEAYRKLAAAWRRRFDIPVIVVAGSVGKTTSKELLHSVLQGRWQRILKTQASQNGFIGVAMTLLELRPEHQAAVIEVGIDEIGAMAQHMELLAPNAGLLTAIGPEHLEKLIDVPTVAREEAIALEAVHRARGALAINLDDPWIAPLEAKLPGGQRRLYSLRRQGPGIVAGRVEPGARGEPDRLMIEDGDGSSAFALELPLPGAHNALNLLGVVALARALGLEPGEIQRGLATFQGAAGRSELHSLPGGTPVVCDYYNANPSSVVAGLELLADVAAREGARRRRWAVLADMLELGAGEERFHRELSDAIVRLGIENVLLHGPRMAWLADELRQRGYRGAVEHFDSKPELSRRLIRDARAGDAILIKGSRGMRMEEVWKELEPHAKKHWADSSAH